MTSPAKQDMSTHTLCGKPQQGGIRQPDASAFVRLAGFVGDSIVDGPGLRCALFCQGCPHGCPGCHNPDTWPFTGGTLHLPDELFARIQGYPLCRAVTFSGGEPFAQSTALLPLATRLRAAGYELASYTGYTFEALMAGSETQQALLHTLDTLIDGPFVLAQRDLTLRFRGSTNQRILNIPASLAAGRAVAETAPRWSGGNV